MSNEYIVCHPRRNGRAVLTADATGYELTPMAQQYAHLKQAADALRVAMRHLRQAQAISREENSALHQLLVEPYHALAARHDLLLRLRRSLSFAMFREGIIQRPDPAFAPMQAGE